MQHKILYLSRKAVEGLQLSMSEVIKALEDMFKQKGYGQVEMPPKPGIHPRPNAFIHAMPAYLPSQEAAGIKWVSGYPQNQAKGLPYISGLLILNDPATGIPLVVMDCTWITAQRTGAATAVAAKYLARKDSSTVGVIACGVQGRSNLEALCCVFPIKQVKAYDVRADISRAFAQEMSERLQVEIEPVQQAVEAVRNLDIVVTSGPILKNPRPVIPRGWLSKGSFACPLDFDSYWRGDAFQEADMLVTDDVTQMDYYREEGYFRATPQPDADLGEVVAGKKPGRTSASQKIISLQLGIALEDVATAILIYNKAINGGIGVELTL